VLYEKLAVYHELNATLNDNFSSSARLWYILVQSNQSNSESADYENYRFVNSAYELRIHLRRARAPAVRVYSEYARLLCRYLSGRDPGARRTRTFVAG
jgi:hypothetical protein